jgi:hypothetical protein
MTVDWQTGTPVAPGLYLTVEEYADSADVGIRIFTDARRWSGMGTPRIALWAPFPYPPGYRVLSRDDPGLLVPARCG